MKTFFTVGCAVAVLATSVVGCIRVESLGFGDDDGGVGESGGSGSTGKGSGGAVGYGGKSTGGDQSAGGAVGYGGKSTGGDQSAGGAVGYGGKSTGGDEGSGGSASYGGRSSSGGSESGGASAAGGKGGGLSANGRYPVDCERGCAPVPPVCVEGEVVAWTDDDCCLRCLSVTELAPDYCFVEGARYQDGEVVYEEDCRLCRCIRGRIGCTDVCAPSD